MSEKANEGLAQADTQLTTFFSGRDFGEDILGSLKSDIQIVGMAQDFSGVMPQPAIKLPAFALQFRMKDPEETRPELRRVFQSFVGFLNVVGAMEGKPQLDLGLESMGDAQFNIATYVAPRDERESVNAPINFNFSPTLAFADDRLILSSSILLAKELVSKSKSEPHAASSPNTAAYVDADMLQQVLKANQAQLVANNMLEKGHSKQAAEGEIDLFLELVRFFQDLTLDLDITDNYLQLTAELKLDADQVE